MGAGGGGAQHVSMGLMELRHGARGVTRARGGQGTACAVESSGHVQVDLTPNVAVAIVASCLA